MVLKWIRWLHYSQYGPAPDPIRYPLARRPAVRASYVMCPRYTFSSTGGEVFFPGGGKAPAVGLLPPHAEQHAATLVNRAGLVARPVAGGLGFLGLEPDLL